MVPPNTPLIYTNVAEWMGGKEAKLRISLRPIELGDGNGLHGLKLNTRIFGYPEERHTYLT